MSTPQDSPKRRKQKARRTKQLLEWRVKQGTSTETKPAAAKPAAVAKPAVAAKPVAKKTAK